MAPVVFLLGASGYLGGHIAVRIAEDHPEWTVNAMVRSSEQADAINKVLPRVHCSVGDLDNAEFLIEQASKADMVIDAASADHVAAAKALVAGLAQRDSTGNRHLIHVSGTGVLADYAEQPGKQTPRIWSDVADIADITGSLPSTQSHRTTDQAVMDGGLAANVPTAILAPPTIYGVGRGPLNRRSMQVPMLIAAFLQRGKGFTLGEGTATWGQLSVDDTASAVIFMAEQVLLGAASKADWGEQGYYFPENGEYSWKAVAEAAAQYLVQKGVFASAELDQLTAEETIPYFAYGPFVWGANCRAVGDRMRALGWRPKGRSLLEDLPAQIEFERDMIKSA